MRFVDLFCGLGGFHVALSKLGHNCVFACEIDEELNKCYQKNFNIVPDKDIKKTNIKKIPKHEILCAGFPCQPFSKAGQRLGKKCNQNGDLFNYVLDILSYHRPRYFILENVPHLVYHNKGKTWLEMSLSLKSIGYKIRYDYFSPHDIGIPQKRSRVFIVGSFSNLSYFHFPKKNKKQTDIKSFLIKSENHKKLQKEKKKCLQIWQEFLKHIPKDEKPPSFPIYIDFLKRKNPNLKKQWELKIFLKNKSFYLKNQIWIKKWITKTYFFENSWKKFEWQCGNVKKNIWNQIIQFRPSGIRIKQTQTFPSLVSISATQIPIIGWEKRYISPEECLKLQSLSSLKHFPHSRNQWVKALGNAVNSDVVYKIAKNLLKPCLRKEQEKEVNL